jgi:long-chain acyl-CoA synthetase
MTHSQIMAAMAGILPIAHVVTTDDIYICYLPLAHVLEMVIENSLFYFGGMKFFIINNCKSNDQIIIAALGYSSSRTLTDQFTRNCKSDFEELKPTLMTGVPSIWEKFRKVAMHKLQKEDPWKRFIFNVAYRIKKRIIANGHSTPLLDRFIFNRILKLFPGNMKAMVTGYIMELLYWFEIIYNIRSAPLPPETHNFLRICFSCPVIQCFGLTEGTSHLIVFNNDNNDLLVCGPGTVSSLDDPSTGSVGFPALCCEVKLVDVPEMHYSSSDDPPKGEVCIRGFNVANGITIYQYSPFLCDVSCRIL